MIFRNYVALWVSAFVLAFFYIGHYTFGRDAAKIVMDSLVIGSAATIFMTLFRAAMRSMAGGVRDGGDNLLIGIWGIWTVLFFYFNYVQAFGIAGRPEWVRLSPIGGTFSTLIFLSGAYVIMAPVNSATRLEKTSMVWWLLAVAIGMFVAGAIMSAAFLKVLVLS